MENLYYALFLIVIGAISFGGVWLKRKYNIKDDENKLLHLMLQIANFITQKVDFKYQQGLVTVINYALEALAFVENFEEIQDIQEKILIIKDKAIEICEENKLEIDDGTIEIIDMIIDYLLEEKIIK